MENPKVRVFISWSGEKSQAIAGKLASWLPRVIQLVEPYFSPDDVVKGTRWNTEISTQLEASRIGLLCVTDENLTAPWLLYEAGALSKSMQESRVCPLLFGVTKADLTGPLAQLQAADFTLPEVRRLVGMINGELSQGLRLDESVLMATFDTWWPQLEGEISAILKTPAKGVRTKRDHGEILAEILDLARATRRDVDRIASVPLADEQLIEITRAAQRIVSALEAFVIYTDDSMSTPTAYWGELEPLVDAIAILINKTVVGTFLADNEGTAVSRVREKVTSNQFPW